MNVNDTTPHTQEKQQPTGRYVPPSTGFLRLPDVLRLIPVSRSTWLRWCDSGKAPKPIRLSHSVVAWRAEAVHALIDQLTQGEAIDA